MARPVSAWRITKGRAPPSAWAANAEAKCEAVAEDGDRPVEHRVGTDARRHAPESGLIDHVGGFEIVVAMRSVPTGRQPPAKRRIVPNQPQIESISRLDTPL